MRVEYDERDTTVERYYTRYSSRTWTVSATLLLRDVMSTALTTTGYQLISSNCRSLLDPLISDSFARLFPGCAAVFFSSFSADFFFSSFHLLSSSYLLSYLSLWYLVGDTTTTYLILLTVLSPTLWQLPPSSSTRTLASSLTLPFRPLRYANDLISTFF